VDSSSSVTVFCVACRTEVAVRSRIEYSYFDEKYQAECRTGVVLYRATLDDLLDLPPHAVVAKWFRSPDEGAG
jgi:hypothetical protein